MKTKHNIGYTYEELNSLCMSMNLDKEKLFKHLAGCTGMIIDGDFITYKCDVETAIKCCNENRNMTSQEFD